MLIPKRSAMLVLNSNKLLIHYYTINQIQHEETAWFTITLKHTRLPLVNTEPNHTTGGQSQFIYCFCLFNRFLRCLIHTSLNY